MITTSDTVKITDGSIVRFVAPDIEVTPRLNTVTGETTARIDCLDTNAISVGVTEYYYTKPEIAAFTGSGANDVETYQDAVEQAVKDSLETLNVSATFTIV